MVEELTEDDVRAQLETNFFGALWVTQAALPIMRTQGVGHLIQVTSEGGVTAFPGIGAYHASKWALEGLSQSLAQEVKSLGIRVTLVEPGPYATDWLGVGATRSEEHPAYVGVREALRHSWDGGDVGDPSATRAAILKVVDAASPPLRIFFGKTPLAEVTADYESRLAEWNAWQPIAVAAFGK
jgi:NAD(P)-dependent dehydrogenase (short-subunit alcohol dehydrogenase family)